MKQALDNFIHHGVEQSRLPNLRSWSKRVLLASVVLLASHYGDLKAASLSSEISAMLQTHPDVKAALQKVSMSSSDTNIARAGLLPNLSVNNEIGWNRYSTEAIRNSDDGVKDLYQKISTVTLRQPVFNNRGAYSNVKASKVAEEAAEAQLNQVVQSSISNAMKAYTELMRVKRLIKLNDQKIESIRAQAKLEDARVKSGSGMTLDVLQAKARLQRALDDGYGLTQRLDRAKASYTKAFAVEPAMDEMVDDLSDKIMVPTELSQALAMAQTSSPSLIKAALDASSAEERVSAARAGYLPAVNVVASYNWAKDDQSEGLTHETRAYMEVNWDLFSGMETVNQVEKQASVWGQMLSASDSAKLSVEEAVRSSWTRLAVANQRKELYKNGLELANETLKAKQQLRQSGKETALGVMDAEIEVFQAQSNQVNAEYDAKQAASDIAVATGLLTPDSLGVEPPDMAIVTTGSSFKSSSVPVKEKEADGNNAKPNVKKTSETTALDDKSNSKVMQKQPATASNTTMPQSQDALYKANCYTMNGEIDKSKPACANLAATPLVNKPSTSTLGRSSGTVLTAEPPQNPDNYTDQQKLEQELGIRPLEMIPLSPTGSNVG